MATVYAIGTNQNNWTKGSAGSIGTMTTQDGWSYMVGLPAVATGRNVISSLAEANSLCCAFSGTQAGKKVKVRIWGFNNVTVGPVSSMGLFLAELQVTLGNTLHNGLYFAHTIEVVTDATLTPPGIRFAGSIDPNVSQTVAVMLFDSMGCSTIVIEMQDIDGSAAPNPFWRPI